MGHIVLHGYSPRSYIAVQNLDGIWCTFSCCRSCRWRGASVGINLCCGLVILDICC